MLLHIVAGEAGLAQAQGVGKVATDIGRQVGSHIGRHALDARPRARDLGQEHGQHLLAMESNGQMDQRVTHVEGRIAVEGRDLSAGQRAGRIAAAGEIRLHGAVVVLHDAQTGVQPLPVHLAPDLTLAALLSLLQRITVVDGFRGTWKWGEGPLKSLKMMLHHGRTYQVGKCASY